MARACPRKMQTSDIRTCKESGITTLTSIFLRFHKFLYFFLIHSNTKIRLRAYTIFRRRRKPSDQMIRFSRTSSTSTNIYEGVHSYRNSGGKSQLHIVKHLLYLSAVLMNYKSDSSRVSDVLLLILHHLLHAILDSLGVMIPPMLSIVHKLCHYSAGKYLGESRRSSGVQN